MWKQIRFCLVSLIAWLVLQPPTVELAFKPSLVGAGVISTCAETEANRTAFAQCKLQLEGNKTKLEEKKDELQKKELDNLLANNTIKGLKDELSNCNLQLNSKGNDTTGEAYKNLAAEFAAYKAESEQLVLKLEIMLKAKEKTIDCLTEELEESLQKVANIEEELLESNSKILDLEQELDKESGKLSCLKEDLQSCLETEADLKYVLKKNDEKLEAAELANSQLEDEVSEKNKKIECLKEDLERSLEQEAILKFEIKVQKNDFNNTNDELLCLKTIVEDRTRELEVLNAKYEDGVKMIAELKANLSLCGTVSGTCKTGKVVLWNVPTDGSVINSFTCPGDESELNCPNGQNIQILLVDNGLGDGSGITDASSACVTSRDDVMHKISEVCPTGSSSCKIEADDGFWGKQCLSYRSKLEIYYTCSTT